MAAGVDLLSPLFIQIEITDTGQRGEKGGQETTGSISDQWLLQEVLVPPVPQIQPVPAATLALTSLLTHTEELQPYFAVQIVVFPQTTGCPKCTQWLGLKFHLYRRFLENCVFFS